MQDLSQVVVPAGLFHPLNTRQTLAVLQPLALYESLLTKMASLPK
jgi:hypothetical protein